MTTSPAVAAPDRLDDALHGRGTFTARVLWHLGGPGRRLAVGSPDILLGIVGAGAAVCVLLAMQSRIDDSGRSIMTPLLWFAVVRVITLVTPLRITHDRFAVALTLDTALLSYWLMTGGPSMTVTLCLVASFAAELLRTHVLSIAGVNLGISTSSVVAAASVFTITTRPGAGSEVGLGPCLAAAAAYILVDHVASTTVLVAMGERPTWRVIAPPSLWLGLLVGAVATGPGWALARLDADGPLGAAVLAGTVCVMLLLASLVTTVHADRARLRSTIAFLHRMPSFCDEREAFADLEQTARRVTRSPDVVVRTEPPMASHREIGFPLGCPASSDGRWLVAEVRELDARLHPAEAGALETLAVVAGDAFALRREARETLWLATHDQLTGLANRTELLTRMLDAEQDPRAQAGATSACVLIDIDGFKGVNDGISHEAGDHVLAVLGPRIAATATGRAGADAVACRLGGDEFAVFLPDVDSPGEVQSVCDALRESIRIPIEWYGRHLRLDASIGFSMGPQILATSLVREADTAMYLVKHSGKGGIARYEATA